ncbi:MAG: hypothetical protein QOE88_790, partial [Verrucomicrobiota bacterium]|nr:hypothetical protein [Verrucomicrobiota bacterium]
MIVLCGLKGLPRRGLQFGHLQGLPTALDRGYSGSGRGSLNHGGVADHIGWRA